MRLLSGLSIRWRAIAWQWLPLLAWMLAIFLLSHQSKTTLTPAQPSAFIDPTAANWWIRLPGVIGADWDTVAGKLAHVAVFGVLAYLFWRVWANVSFVLSATLLYGLTDEFHQRFIPGRTSRWSDLLFDAAGALLVVWWLQRHRSHYRPAARIEMSSSPDPKRD